MEFFCDGCGGWLGFIIIVACLAAVRELYWVCHQHPELIEINEIKIKKKNNKMKIVHGSQTQVQIRP